MTSKLNELKQICISDNIPIIRDDVIEYFVTFFRNNNIQTILEIGTGYGFSSLLFLSLNNNTKITTIEKDENRIEIAKKFLTERTKIIKTDIRDFETNEKYDFIFLDGPKSCQIEIFEKLKDNLSKNGTIIIDNVFLNDLSKKSDSKRVKKIIEKNNKFIDYLKKLDDWNFNIVNIGDGIGELKKCKS